VQGAVALAGYLCSSGVDVIVGFLQERGPGTELVKTELRLAGVKTHCLNLPGWLGMLGVRRVRRYVRAMEFDVVLSYSFRPDIVNWSLGKSVFRVCNIRENYDAWRRRYGWKGILAVHLMERIWKDVEGLVTLTKAMADDLRGRGIRKTSITVVPNFIDVAAIRRQLAAELPQEDDKNLLIGYFGLLENWKRVDVTLEAFASLIHEDGLSEVHYHVVGDGPERQNLEELACSLDITDYVTFHGYVARPWLLMARMHIHVLASESEGLPRCIMEGMALGKTCIASNLLGMTELIEHGRTGYLVEPGDTDSMRGALRAVVETRSLLPSSVVTEHIESQHDAPVCGQKLLDGLHRMMEASSTGLIDGP